MAGLGEVSKEEVGHSPPLHTHISLISDENYLENKDSSEEDVVREIWEIENPGMKEEDGGAFYLKSKIKKVDPGKKDPSPKFLLKNGM